MRYGNFLPDNGTIGFVAPAFGCNIEPYYSGFLSMQRKIRERGYHCKPGPNCFEGKGIGISNHPRVCGEEFQDYYRRDDVDCLISCGGGELMCEILDYIDFEAIREQKAKWFMGYSDNTNLTFLLATLCDTASIYGPCAATFGMEPWHEALEDAFGLLTGKKLKDKMLTVKGYPLWEKESLKSEENPLAAYNLTEPKILKSFPSRDLQFSGRLLGGCIDCLVNLIGTNFDRTQEFVHRYKEDGIIWFLEACDLNVFSLRRAMWQMEHAGWFKYAKGFLIGRPRLYGERIMGLDAYEATMSVAGSKNIPVVMDADLGHLPPMMPLITGSMGHVTVKENDITVKMELV